MSIARDLDSFLSEKCSFSYLLLAAECSYSLRLKTLVLFINSHMDNQKIASQYNYKYVKYALFSVAMRWGKQNFLSGKCQGIWPVLLILPGPQRGLGRGGFLLKWIKWNWHNVCLNQGKNGMITSKYSSGSINWLGEAKINILWERPRNTGCNLFWRAVMLSLVGLLFVDS